MSRFSISTRNGRVRASSEDGENITLLLWDKAGFSAVACDHEVTVKIGDLRQIVAHFDWLEDNTADENDRNRRRHQQVTHEGFSLDLDANLVGKLVAKHLARQIAKGILHSHK